MRHVVLTEGQELADGSFLDRYALYPIGDDISVWLKGQPRLPIGVARDMLRDPNGDVSFDIEMDWDWEGDPDVCDFSCAVEQLLWKHFISVKGTRWVLTRGTITGIEIYPRKMEDERE